MSNQGARQASVRAVTGTDFTYEGDWHSLFTLAGIPVGTYNERLLAWINDYMGESFTELNGAMAAFAIDQGADSWNGLGTFDAVGFTPADIPDLALWLDASDTSTIIQTGGSVSQWNDKSVIAGNVTQATGVNQPTTGTQTINGKNAISFDGAGDRLMLAPASFNILNGDFVIFEVARQKTIGQTGVFYQFARTGADVSIRVQVSDTSMDGYIGDYGQSFSLGPYVSDTNPHTFIVRKTGLSGTFSRDNLTSAANLAANLVMTSGTIGSYNNGSAASSLNVGEILIYSRSLSNAEINQVGQYLAAKWGTTWTNI